LLETQSDRQRDRERERERESIVFRICYKHVLYSHIIFKQILYTVNSIIHANQHQVCERFNLLDNFNFAF